MTKYIEVLDRFGTEVQKDSDIGIAVMGANIIDSMLKDMLLLVTTEKSYVFEEAFNLNKYKYNPDKFFQRINRLDEMKLLSEKNTDLLHKFRLVRNAFGHELLVTDFDRIVYADERAHESLAGFHLPENSYFLELEQLEDGKYYIIDMNPIKTNTSLHYRFIFLFNYLFHNLRWTIEYLTIENEKNTSYTEQLSKKVSFNFEDYIHTKDGSFNYVELYNIRKNLVEFYVTEHMGKLKNDRNNLFSIIEEQLEKYPGDKNMEKQARQIRLEGELVYKKGMDELEMAQKQMADALKMYTYYYKSFEASRKYNEKN